MQSLTCSLSLHDHYRALSHLPGFVLLESDQGFDILTAMPYDKLSSMDFQPNFFHHLQQKLPVISSSLDLPFQGGALGYFSYEAGAGLMEVPVARISRFDHLPSMHMGFYDWAIITDHRHKKITLFAANTQSETMQLLPHIMDLWSHNIHQSVQLFHSSPFNSLITRKAYQHHVETIQDYLKQGRCYQVNYTQPFLAEYSGEAFDLYQRISANNPVPFGAFFSVDNAHILSFSPERFLSFDRGFLSTSPIKGTVKSVADETQDILLREQLKQCKKNRAENVMIVDLWRNDLGKIAKPGSVTVPSLFEIQSFRGLHHLVSTIQAESLESLHPVEIFKACFPGGSVTGTPKKEAMQVIAELEPYTRGIYCGSMAYFSSHGRFDSNIAIRTLVYEKDRLHLAAGGAIVMDSLWKDEYAECFTKIAGITNAIAR